MTLISSFLGAAPGQPDWQVAELASRRRVLASWLSEVETAGGTLDRASAAYLARARRRVASLHAVGHRLAAAHDVTLLKGSVIARHLPPGTLRQSGDVDLVAPDEATLWRVVRDVRRQCGAVVRGVSVLRDGTDRHLGVWLKWPAEDPLLDKPMGADVTTCTFAGDLKRVPPRTAHISDADLLSLFAVAEERFQRKFRIKDLVDLVVLAPVLAARYGPDLPDIVGEWAARLCLAPELLQLSERVLEWQDLPDRWLAVTRRLEQLSTEELTLRRAGRTIPTAHYGLRLDDVATDALTIHDTPAGELATTPAGTFLLVDSSTTDQDTYELALVAAKTLHQPDTTATRREEPCVTSSV